MRYSIRYKDNNFLTPTTYTQEISEYAENLKYEDLPAEVVERAKLILLQTIGVALAAKDTPLAGKVMKMALESNNGEGGPVTVWGTGKKMSALNASLVLGTLADLLDWEDCSWTGHPSAGVIPCAWLAAEEKHKSGKELLAGIVAAYELYQRIAMAVQPSERRWKEKGWGLTSWQIFAATIAACKVYGLDARQINQAIGLACEASPIPASYHSVTMSDFYHYEHGYRARDGFLNAKTVEKGINNNRDGLDEATAYTAAMCGSAVAKCRLPGEGDDPEADLTWFTRDLGSRYLIMETLLKRWPANMWIQTPAEILADLVKEYGFGPEDVEEIVVDPGIKNRMWAPEDGFTSITHAQFSVPYVLAAMLYHPVPGAVWYDPAVMQDPKVIALAQRVKGGASEEDSPMKGFMMFRNGEFPEKTLTVKLKDGRELVGKMDRHPGHPQNMMSMEEVAERFRMQAAGALDSETMEKVIDMICNIETVDDIAVASELLK